MNPILFTAPYSFDSSAESMPPSYTWHRDSFEQQLGQFVTDIDALNDYGCSLLHHASEKETPFFAEILLNKGANLEVKDHLGRTPLHIACERENIPLTTCFLENNADIHAIDSSGKTPLHIACETKNIPLVTLLLAKNANVHATDSTGKTPLHYVCLKKSERLAKLLIDHGARADCADKDGRTPLHKVARFGRSSFIKLLLSAGADINAQTSSERSSPLHEACDAGANVRTVRCLVEHGALTDSKNAKGDTPLHLATIHKMTRPLEYLIEFKQRLRGGVSKRKYSRFLSTHRRRLGLPNSLNSSDIKPENFQRQTPLHRAVKEANAFAVCLLLNAGAENTPDIDGKTPKDLAKGLSEFQILFLRIPRLIRILPIHLIVRRPPLFSKAF